MRHKQPIRFAASRAGARRGVQLLESILVIPILAIVTVAAIQFATSTVVLETVESAAAEGAREGGKAAATAMVDSQIVDAVEAAVEEVLSVHGLTVDSTAGSGVKVIVNDSAGQLATSPRGDLNLILNTSFASPVAGELQVIVIVSFDPAVANPDPLPNALKTFGLDFTGKQFEISSIAKKE